MPPKEGKRTSRTALEVVSGQIDVVADVHRSEQETVEGNHIFSPVVRLQFVWVPKL